MTILSRLTLAATMLAAADPWTLPRETNVVEAGPRAYTFRVDYVTGETHGNVLRRQRLEARYTRGLPGGDATWTSVTVADATGPKDPFGPAQPRAFMEGFRYRHAAGFADSMRPDFFKGFPPDAVMERNLVWDTQMIELFGQQQLAHLKLNEPIHVLSEDTVDMPGVGTFKNRDVTLVWLGRGRRNGQDCAIVQYRAFQNPLSVDAGGVRLVGRSHYWGEIWVSLATRQIEYATLDENVLGELTLPGQSAPQLVDVLRTGVLEPLQRQ